MDPITLLAVFIILGIFIMSLVAAGLVLVVVGIFAVDRYKRWRIRRDTALTGASE